jgi:hypothetical protein
MFGFLFLQQARRNSWQQYLNVLDAVQPYDVVVRRLLRRWRACCLSPRLWTVWLAK